MSDQPYQPPRLTCVFGTSPHKVTFAGCGEKTILAQPEVAVQSLSPPPTKVVSQPTRLLLPAEIVEREKRLLADKLGISVGQITVNLQM